MPRKMTKFVLNDLFEDIKLFLERASNSDQIKSSLVGYVFLLEVLHFKSLRCYTMSAKNSTVSLSLSFPKKVENALACLHILLTSRKKKNKIYFLKDQNLCKTLPLFKYLS